MVRTNAASVFRRLFVMLLQRRKQLKQLSLECGYCEFADNEEDEMLASLQAILPGLEHVDLDLSEPLQWAVALHVLPSCHNLSSLTISVPQFDSLVPFLESTSYVGLRRLECFAVRKWTSDQARAFAQRLRECLYLRNFVFHLGSSESNGIVASAAVELTSILRVARVKDPQILKEIIDSPTLTERLRTHIGPHARDISLMLDNENSVLCDLFVQFPGHFVVPRSCEGTANVLRIGEALCNPACRPRTLSTDLENSGVTEESLLSLSMAISSCLSLLEVRLLNIPGLWLLPIISLFDTSLHLKRLAYSLQLTKDKIIGRADVTVSGLAEAMARNEVVEHIQVTDGFDLPHVVRELTAAVKARNVAICVRTCRLLFLSWIRERECEDGVPCETSVVYDILVSAELDWAEKQRSAAEAQGSRIVAVEMVQYRQERKRSKRCVVF